MAHLEPSDIQVWLDPDKILIPENDPIVEDQTFVDIVFAKVGQVYVTTTWTTPTTTPPLIKRILAMLIAANRYNKLYSEEEDAGNRYAGKLEAKAQIYLDMLINGQLLLTDSASVILEASNDPIFYPDDVTGASEILNALGDHIGEPGSEDIKFRMADTW